MHGTGYLDHAEGQIKAVLANILRVLFVPFALKDVGGYAARARRRFESMGYALDSLHEAASAHEAIQEAAALFVGGGNTFPAPRRPCSASA